MNWKKTSLSVKGNFRSISLSSWILNTESCRSHASQKILILKRKQSFFFLFFFLRDWVSFPSVYVLSHHLHFHGWIHPRPLSPGPASSLCLCDQLWQKKRVKYVHEFDQRASPTCTDTFASKERFDRGYRSRSERGQRAYKCHYLDGTSVHCAGWGWALLTARRGRWVVCISLFDGQQNE